MIVSKNVSSDWKVNRLSLADMSGAAESKVI